MQTDFPAVPVRMIFWHVHDATTSAGPGRGGIAGSRLELRRSRECRRCQA
jgi:hypothetical protein